ncbi:5'-AMP-activated protein kinase regulatory beta subunit protein [Dioscorea alata]|uniref:5'-AMP-activated protein kinase regulatory beta subunit protein n=1 Tax=Dioscorea alata TaxID=55571 RepID=A0ACB7UWR5_DIOAL|nr:5'-AMP-activated protein kinase regulatory beta subunit protein [Dioscorea alata]
MGNATSVRESSNDLMEESPAQSPIVSVHSPLLFNPEIPVASFNRFEHHECFEEEQGIPTMIMWSNGGKDVAVEGSWDDWKSKKKLQKSGKDFTIMKVLPSGVYHYRFLVDGEWKHAPDVPLMIDETGNVYNILDLQDFISEDLGSIASFEPPLSPDSSYSNTTLCSEDYAKEPPLVPLQLYPNLLNMSFNKVYNQSTLSRPQHVVLDHLYIQKTKNRQPVVALAATRRFKAKYVTVVLFKSLQS